MMDEEYWDAEYWEHVRRCDENGKATANNMPNDAIISVLHAALIVYITECREVDDADGEMYARQAQEWLDSLPQPPEPDWSHRNGETEPPEVEGYYWFQWEDALSWLCVEVRDAGYDHEMSLMVLWPGLQTPDYIDSIVGRWYGPIPEPTQESNAA